MVQRRQKRKIKRTRQAIAKGDEPPDPVTATIVSAVIGAGATLGTAAIAKSGNKAPKVQQPKSPIQAGESTELKPGERQNLINTGPQGLLDDSTTGRKNLLGG